MNLNVKNKIWLGTLFLFLLLMLSGGVSIFYMVKLKNEAKSVLADNYESLRYAHAIQQQLNVANIRSTTSLQKFEAELLKQEGNITEPGEREATRLLRQDFTRLKQGDTSKQNIMSVQNALQTILSLNMKAIHNKNAKAEDTAGSALTIIISLSFIIFLIAITFLANFPAIVTHPIKELSEAIKQIGNKNYKHRIHINNKDEFGQLADAFNDMAERLEYFESSNLNKLLFEKSRAEAVINSLKDASIGIDKNNIILFANYYALQLLELNAAAVVGKSVGELTAKNNLFRFLIDNESSAPFKIVLDNKENYFIKEMVEVAQGDTNSKVVVLKNITSYKELDVAKTNFIATISHELKTPLASSDFSLKLLLDKRVGKLSAEQHELAENLKQDNERMLKILSELLNMSQVESGKIQLNVQKVDPAQIITNAVQAVWANAKEKGVTIQVKTEDNLPWVQTDADKTTWVLNNFLTNAIKYSSPNGVVEIFTKKLHQLVVFSVQDHGQGIAKEFQSRIFERYFQVPGAKAKGTGIGLSISKEFIEALQGKIWVESEVGRGATFSFQLPETEKNT